MSASRPISLDTGMPVRTAWMDRTVGATIAALPIRPSPVQMIQHQGTVQQLPVERLSTSNPTTHKTAGAATVSPTDVAVQQQLTWILQSKSFILSDKLSRFLRFVVEHVLQGTSECLKEYLIGVEVYNRKPPYDPSQDSIVRTEARRLRSKLKEYYETEGKDDALYIYLRPGSYVPLFHCRDDRGGASFLAEPEAFLLPKSSSISVVILPFRDISNNPVSSTFARGIPDELAYILMMTFGCSVISSSRLATLDPQHDNVAEVMNKLGAHIAYEGSVRVEGPHLRITARILDANGGQLWVKRLDVESGKCSSFTIEEQIATALSVGVDHVRNAGFSQPRRPSRTRTL